MRDIVPLEAGDERHGTPNGYNNFGCRCGKCKEAYREFQLVQTARRKSGGIPDNDFRHGEYNGYANYGCRCAACKEANRLYSIDYRLRRGIITLEKAKELRAGASRERRSEV